MLASADAAASSADTSATASLTQEKLIVVAEAIAPYVAEFIGTFFVVFTVGCNTISGDRTWMPTSISFAVMVAMYATSSVSGGHLNPTLSLSLGLSGKLRWFRVCLYMIVQLAAGLLAGGITLALLHKPVAVGPHAGFDWFDSMIVEVIYSSTFSFVALNCMASLRNNPKHDRNQFFALAVGFVTIAGGHTTGEISGAFFNPAVTLGFGLTGGTVAQRFWSLLYAGYQFTGALLATLLFFLVRPEELVALGIIGEGLSCGRACTALSFCTGRDSQGDAEAPDAPESARTRARSPFAARVLSEFLGTYVVVFTFGLSTAMLSTRHAAAAQSPANGTVAAFRTDLGGEIQLLEAVEESSTVAWATGSAVLCMSYSLANISGGHFNPAVTLAVLLTGSCRGPGRRRCRVIESLFFMLAQATAAVAAALTYVCVHRGDGLTNPGRVADLGPKPGYGWSSVAIGESAFTLAVALSVLCMTTVRDPRYSKAPSTKSFQFAFAIGMCVTAGGFALEGITGGFLNPAVSLGVSVSNFFCAGLKIGMRARYFAYYVLWQFVGGVLAALVFRAAHPLEYKEDPLLK